MDDSDEDIPIAEIIRRKKEAAAAAAAKTQKEVAKSIDAKFVVELKKPIKDLKRKSNDKDSSAEPLKKKKVENNSNTSKSNKSKSKEASKKVVKPKKKSKEDDDDDDDDDDDEENSDSDAAASDDNEDEDEDGAPRRSSKRVVSSLPAEARDGFYSTRKGFLAQCLLVRWWYAIKWPEEDKISKALSGYEALDGFKGVFISTQQGSLGAIQDTRNRDTCPCLANFKKKRSSDIKELCAAAYSEQIRQLVAAEGSGSALEARLKRELKEVMAVDCDDADREAERFASKRK